MPRLASAWLSRLFSCLAVCPLGWPGLLRMRDVFNCSISEQFACHAAMSASREWHAPYLPTYLPHSPWALCCTNNKKWPDVVNEIPKAIILNFNSTEGSRDRGCRRGREGRGRGVAAHWVNLVFNFICTRATLRNSRWIKLFKMSNNYSNANGTLTCALCKEGGSSLPRTPLPFPSI